MAQRYKGHWCRDKPGIIPELPGQYTQSFGGLLAEEESHWQAQ